MVHCRGLSRLLPSVARSLGSQHGSRASSQVRWYTQHAAVHPFQNIHPGKTFGQRLQRSLSTQHLVALSTRKSVCFSLVSGSGLLSCCIIIVLPAGTEKTGKITCMRHSQKLAASDGPDISQLRPDLQAQWMHDRNRHLGSIVLTPNSARKAWWLCKNCPDGHPHIWESTIDGRSNGKGCPFCAGSKVCKHNSLATKAPQVALYWHCHKNLPLSPDTVTVCSGYRAHWFCSACKHEWQARVADKCGIKSGCPKCARANGGRSRDGVRQKHPTFASCNHPLLSQWDYSLNEQHGNYPDNTTLGSNKLIWWTCGQCPRGHKHSWQARPVKRTGNLPRGCPVCAGRKVCECNSLQTWHPDIAADFDVIANGLTPAEVTTSTHQKFRWRSDTLGAKLRSVAERTYNVRRLLKMARINA